MSVAEFDCVTQRALWDWAVATCDGSHVAAEAMLRGMGHTSWLKPGGHRYSARGAFSQGQPTIKPAPRPYGGPIYRPWNFKRKTVRT